MLTRLSVAAIFAFALAAVSSFTMAAEGAQDTPARLRYTAPNDWTPGEDAQIRNHLPAFSKMLAGTTTAPPPMSREDILAIAGNWEWDGYSGYGRDALPHNERARMQSYLFSIDGRVAWSEGGPAMNFKSPSAFDRLSATVGHTVGTYFKRGDHFVMRFGAPPYYMYFANVRGPDTLEILGYTYHRTKRAAP